MKNDRVVYFDYLRLFAALFVILLHVSSAKFNSSFETNRSAWLAMNFFDAISRWCVPIFVMISGTLFLGRELSIKQLYRKYILRIAFSCCVWSSFYAVVEFLKNRSIKTLVAAFFNGKYHLWFLPMIIGLYMCIPFFKKIVQSRKLMWYYLILSFLFAFLFPTVKKAFNLAFEGSIISSGIDVVYKPISDMHMDVVLGYGAYFVLGFACANHDFSPKQRKWIYELGILGFVFTVLITWFFSSIAERPISDFYGNFQVFVLFEALSVFVWGKYHFGLCSEKWNGFAKTLSKYSFGVYLVHPFMLGCCDALGIHSEMMNSWLAIPIVAILVAVLSFFASFVLNKIPFLNKWIV